MCSIGTGNKVVKRTKHADSLFWGILSFGGKTNINTHIMSRVVRTMEKKKKWGKTEQGEVDWVAAIFSSVVKCNSLVKVNLSRNWKVVRWNVLCSFQKLVYFFVLKQRCLLHYRFSGGHFIISRALMLLRFSSIPVWCPSSSGKRTHE